MVTRYCSWNALSPRRGASERDSSRLEIKKWSDLQLAASRVVFGLFCNVIKISTHLWGKAYAPPKGVTLPFGYFILLKLEGFSQIFFSVFFQIFLECSFFNFLWNQYVKHFLTQQFIIYCSCHIEKLRFESEFCKCSFCLSRTRCFLLPKSFLFLCRYVILVQVGCLMLLLQ